MFSEKYKYTSHFIKNEFDEKVNGNIKVKELR